MAESYQRQSALAAFALEARAYTASKDAGVRLCERPARAQLALRGNAGNHRFKSAVKAVLGTALPVAPNTVSMVRACTVLWLGPDEWLVTVPYGREDKLADALGKALAGQHFALVDASASRTLIGLTGTGAREVLMKGCSLDLHPRVFGPGQCAQSTFARCHMLLHQRDDRPSYDLYIHRSFAGYAWQWLEDAAREYGVAVISGDARGRR